MNRRGMILLAVAMIIGALTYSAKAYTIERQIPVNQSVTVPHWWGASFSARFGGLFWPYIWHEAQWYVDGALTYTQTLGGQTDTSGFYYNCDTPGTHEVKVRAKYDTVPFGVHAWTSYLAWTVEVYAHPPVASRVSPDSLVTVYEGDTQAFTARATDAFQEKDIRRVVWYLEGIQQADYEFGPMDVGREHTWSHTFDTWGTYQVEAFFYDPIGPSAPGEAAWTVEVEGHSPIASCVSPASPTTVYEGVPVTFTVEGTDPADDLRLCEVSLDGVYQEDASFSAAASGSTAAWTYTFNTPGTYQVVMVPVDLAGHFGPAVGWTVEVKPDPSKAGLTGMVIELSAQGQAKGPLAGAKVDLTGPATKTATSDGQGQFAFTGLDPGTYRLNVSRAGYYPDSRSVSLAVGETKHEMSQLTPESPEPSAFGFISTKGSQFIEGMPGDLSFDVTVAWNGQPGTVHFTVAGTRHSAGLTDLGGGRAKASLIIPAPAAVASSAELTVEVTNGEGKTTVVSTGVYFSPVPEIVRQWFPDTLTWLPSGPTLTYSKTKTYDFWDFEKGPLSSSANVGTQQELAFDPWAGTLTGSFGGTGGFNIELDTTEGIEFLGEGSLTLSGTVEIALAGDSPTVTPGWRLSASGKAGIGAPVVLVIDAVFPPAAPAVNSMLKVPVVGDLLKALRLRLYLITGGELSGIYEQGQTGDCFLGTTSLSGSLTLGLEGQVVVKIKRWGLSAEAGVYAGGTGTPEIQMCPKWEFESLTVRAYVGVFASAFGFNVSKEVGMNIPLIGDDRQITAMAMPSMLDAGSDCVWVPIGASHLRWGETNRLVDREPVARTRDQQEAPTAGPQEERIVENVSPSASPSVVCTGSETLILFSLHDPCNPWYAATDIGTLRQLDAQAWALERIAYDLAAEFEPKAVAVDSDKVLATWLRVSGDVSDTNDPGQIVPHLDVVTAWFDPVAGAWSTPEQLTFNTVGDRDPLPVVMGSTQGILWIQNDANDTAMDPNLSDRLMFVKWPGDTWSEPQTLWSQPKGILSHTFVADSAGEGHVVFVVDEDGNEDTSTDCELYRLSTVNGVWQTASRLTTDEVEDTLPTLVAPNGVPTCVWSADRTLVYSRLNEWNRLGVYTEQTLAGEAATLDGVTLPGGAAVVYTVQGTSGIDMVASFYDAALDRWSQPRQLTQDEHAETALSLACDGNDLVVSYLKTETLREDMDIDINGQPHHLENIPQPGRTDLYILRYSLGHDVAIVPESITIDPPNPPLGTKATIKAVVENRGDLPLQDVQVALSDGNPHNGGTLIPNVQILSEPLIAGTQREVSVSWTVSSEARSHQLFVVADPSLTVNDRDRSNNIASKATVLPDLAVETCWSSDISAATVAMTARVVNRGVILAGTSTLSWRLGAVDGREIGRSHVEAIGPNGAHEVTILWDTASDLDAGESTPLFAVADCDGVVSEWDENNNVHSLSVTRRAADPKGD